jgi:hypothetical protein
MASVEETKHPFKVTTIKHPDSPRVESPELHKPGTLLSDDSNSQKETNREEYEQLLAYSSFDDERKRKVLAEIDM